MTQHFHSFNTTDESINLSLSNGDFRNPPIRYKKLDSSIYHVLPHSEKFLKSPPQHSATNSPDNNSRETTINIYMGSSSYWDIFGGPNVNSLFSLSYKINVPDLYQSGKYSSKFSFKGIQDYRSNEEYVCYDTTYFMKAKKQGTPIELRLDAEDRLLHLALENKNLEIKENKWHPTINYFLLTEQLQSQIIEYITQRENLEAFINPRKHPIGQPPYTQAFRKWVWPYLGNLKYYDENLKAEITPGELYVIEKKNNKNNSGCYSTIVKGIGYTGLKKKENYLLELNRALMLKKISKKTEHKSRESKIESEKVGKYKDGKKLLKERLSALRGNGE